MTTFAEQVINSLETEGPTWRAIGFNDRTGLVYEAGRSPIDEEWIEGTPYYFRKLYGVSQVAALEDQLVEVAKQPIANQSEALRLRTRCDPFWLYRGLAVEALRHLADAEFFDEVPVAKDLSLNEQDCADPDSQPRLKGYLYRDDISEYFCCEISVGCDGRVSVRIDDDPAYPFCSRKLQPVRWHEYRLTPGQPTASHIVQLEAWNGKPEAIDPRVIYAPSELTIRTLRWLSTVAHHYGMPVDRERLLINVPQRSV